MDILNNRAKLFIQLQLNNEHPDWKAINKICEIILKYNTELAKAREKKVQDIIDNNRNVVEFNLATANAKQGRR